MGVLTKLIDALLFFNFLLMAFVTPVIDAQTCISPSLYPDSFVKLREWYSHEYGDYLFIELPHFFVALVWIEILVHWPLVFINMYAMLASKPWFNTTCLIYGSSVSTSLVLILTDMRRSGKASDKLLNEYYPFMGLGILAIVRGLMPHCASVTDSAELPREKIA